MPATATATPPAADSAIPSYREIAEALGISETHTRTLFRRGLAKLAVQITITADLLGYSTPEAYLASGDSRVVRLEEDPNDPGAFVARIYRPKEDPAALTA